MSTLLNTQTSQHYQEQNLTQWVRSPQTVPKSFRELYNLLMFLSTRDGHCYATNKYLANKLNRPLRTIKYQLRRLGALKFIWINSWAITRCKGKKRNLVTLQSADTFLSGRRFSRIKSSKVRESFYEFMNTLSTPKTKMLPLYRRPNVALLSTTPNGVLEEKVSEYKKPTFSANERIKKAKKRLVKEGYPPDAIESFIELRKPKLEKKGSNPYKYLKTILEDPDHEDTIARELSRKEGEQEASEAQEAKAKRQNLGMHTAEKARLALEQSGRTDISVNADEIGWHAIYYGRTVGYHSDTGPIVPWKDADSVELLERWILKENINIT